MSKSKLRKTKDPVIQGEGMVLVEWHDACLFTGTHTKEESIQKEMGLFKSLGYMISKDSTTTRIAFEQDEAHYRRFPILL